jgi:hypothetical protein
MHPAIATITEGARGCGFRKPGGLYLINRNEGTPCGRVPFPLDLCPCCGEGFRPSRGYRWVDGERLLQDAPACEFESDCRETCSFRPGNEASVGRALLIWISPTHYPTPHDFMNESERMGISRRLSGDKIPRGMIVGETWVFLAHKEAVNGKPGVFHAFVPEQVEYVVRGDETDEQIDKLIARGIAPVNVVNTGG